LKGEIKNVPNRIDQILAFRLFSVLVYLVMIFVLGFERFPICFGFRASDFEFSQ